MRLRVCVCVCASVHVIEVTGMREEQTEPAGLTAFTVYYGSVCITE